MDFIIAKIGAIAIAIIFLVGFLQKISDLEMFELSVDAYDLLPAWAVRTASYGIIFIEGTSVILLLQDRTLKIGGFLSIALLLVVTAAIAANLIRGKTDIGCGCGGIEDEQKISWFLVTRNLLLVTLLLPIFLETTVRHLTLLDYCTLYFGAIAIYGLYALVSQIITNAPRLRGLG